jgi:cysteine-rich repeat protein
VVLATTAPAQAGMLGFLEKETNGGGVTGLNGAESVAVSPDGAHVYAGGAAEDAIAVFSRDGSTGLLSFVEEVSNGGGVSGLGEIRGVSVSPDGAHVYAVGYADDAIAVFARTPATGHLTFVEARANGAGGITTLNGPQGVTVSPDGAHVYVASDVSNAVTVFSRNATTGKLTLVESRVDSSGGITSLAGSEAVVVSPDGAHVYVASQGDNAVTGFSRDGTTGSLTAVVTVQKDGSGVVDGLGGVQSVAISADGAHVYAGGGSDDAIAVFSRNAATGVLTFVERHNASGGVSGLDGVEWVTVGPGGSMVYAVSDVSNALVAFSRNSTTGALTFVETLTDGSGIIDGLGGASGVVTSPGSPHVYVGSKVDDAVAVFGSLCGNGVFNPGEECDDGNLDDNDCCSSVCTNKAAGSTCADDGNVCTDDKCNGAGLCLHVNNTAACDDGLFCTINDVCVSRVCQGQARDCSAAADACNDGVCDDTADACVPQPKSDGTVCDDGSACTQADVCQAGVCTGTDPVVCAPLAPCHEGGVCDPATGQCPTAVSANGTPCDDGNACTRVDVCQAGACVGTTPVVCNPSDQCHDGAECNPATGICSNPAPNGTPCDDGNACTRTDTCQNGACTGGNPIVCTALDQCHGAGTCNPGTGVCSNPALANGSACDDGNACTQTDTCQAGACVGGNPLVCTALDQCHRAGVCNPGTGVCSNPAATNGSACDDGNACTRTDTCQAGACVGSNPVVCTALDQCHGTGTCDPGTGVCSNPPVANGSACNDGNACTQTDTCQAGACAGGDPVVCTALDQCHGAGTCNPGTGVCSNPAVANGSACDDGNACTLGDVCQAGICVGGAPLVCTALDQCHGAGTCNPGTGMCSNPPLGDGTACDDGNACTQTDVCQAGACVGTEPIVCTAMDFCHVAGVCDPATGECSNPSSADGAPCDDGSFCTQTDTCQAGVCTGQNPIVCADLDQCHPGACDPATGTCSTPAAPDGFPCDDGAACTQGDICQAGSCQAGTPVVCTAIDDCHDAGICDPATGQCSNPAKPDPLQLSFGPEADTYTDADLPASNFGMHAAMLLDDSPKRRLYLRFDVAGISGLSVRQAVIRLRTTADANAGSDHGGHMHVVSDTGWDELTLTHDNRPPIDGVLLSSAGPVGPSEVVEFDVTGALAGDGLYSFAVQAESSNMAIYHARESAEGQPELIVFIGAACDDGNACTLGDICAAGACAGAPITCSASDQCHDVGTCDPTTGLCSDPSKADGTACDDGDACTLTDTCAAGACLGGNPVVCAVPDSCHEAVCDPATGLCPAPAPKPEGATCDDGNACTQTDTCLAGSCTGADPVICAAMDDCHEPGVCEPATGACSNPDAADGNACDDGNACTLTDACVAGTCAGANPVICTALDQCHAAGTCDPQSGACSHPAKADGMACDDGNACTRTDVCLGGTCAGTAPVSCVPSDACHAAGVCNPTTGACSDPARPDGTPCDDGNACTQADLCIAGHCAGGDPIVCGPDACHAAGSCDPATGRCAASAKADGTPCDDGDPCSDGDACFGGECVGAPLPDADGDGICDVADLCRGVPDAGQVDSDGDGVGDLCQCTAPAPGRCIAGGGSERTDCLLELNSSGPVSFNGKGTRVRSKLLCIDGDPACDMDGARDGQCTFGLTLCLGNADPRYPRCKSSMVEGVEVLSPAPARSASARLLEDALGALGLEVRRRGRVIGGAGQVIGDNQCTSIIRLAVPAPKGKRAKPVRQKFRLQAYAEDGQRDTDRFVLACE